MLDLAICESYDTRRYPLLTRQVISLSTTHTKNGYGILRAVYRNAPNMYMLYNTVRFLDVKLTIAGVRVFEGRLESVQLRDDTITLTAYGYLRALTDFNCIAFWSSRLYGRWEIWPNDTPGGVSEARYNQDNNNRLQIGLDKNAAYANGNNVAAFRLRVPQFSENNLTAIAFSYTISLPTNWLFVIQSRSFDYNSSVNEFFITSAGATVSGSINFPITVPNAAIVIMVYNNTGALYTNTAESGAFFLTITNLRVIGAPVTTSTRYTSTLSVANAAGSNITITVASTVGLSAGMQVQFNPNVLAAGETVTVASVTNTTQFVVSSITNVYAIGTTIAALKVPVSLIVKQAIATVNSSNATQLRNDTSLVRIANDRDVQEWVIEDTTYLDALNKLASLGDSANNLFNVYIADKQRLAFDTDANTQVYGIVLTKPQLDRLLDIYNGVYAIYKSGAGETLRANIATNYIAYQQNGVIRRKGVNTQSTDSYDATLISNAALADSDDVKTSATIEITEIYSLNTRLRAPLWSLRNGVTLRILYMPPVYSSALQGLREFIIGTVEIDHINNVAKVSPMLPIPEMAKLLAKDVKI